MIHLTVDLRQVGMFYLTGAFPRCEFLVDTGTIHSIYPAGLVGQHQPNTNTPNRVKLIADNKTEMVMYDS